MRKLIKTAFAVAALAAAALGEAQAETVKVGFAAEPYPPFTSPDASGKWVGWEVDIIGAVCAQALPKSSSAGPVSTPVAASAVPP